MDIEVERHGDYAMLWFNRPQAGNKVTVAMLEAARAALAELEADAGIKLVALAGRGAHFCQGRDNVDPAPAALAAIAAFTRALPASAVPIAALVQGQALAAGCGLVLHADLAWVHPEAELGFPELTHGIVPGLSLAYLDRLVPRAVAARMLYTAQPLSGREAYQWGLVTAVTEDPAAALDALLAGWRTVPAQHLRWLKRFRRRVADRPSDAAFEHGIRLVAALGQGDAAAVERLL